MSSWHMHGWTLSVIYVSYLHKLLNTSICPFVNHINFVSNHKDLLTIQNVFFARIKQSFQVSNIVKISNWYLSASDHEIDQLYSFGDTCTIKIAMMSLGHIFDIISHHIYLQTIIQIMILWNIWKITKTAIRTL